MMTSYGVSLASVESPANSMIQYGETQVVMIEQDGLSKYKFEDDYIEIFWYVGTKEFNFELKNKSDYTIKLNWDDMAYVHLNGATSRVMHSGVKYIDRNNSQPASVLPKNASITDILLPTDNIYYSEYIGWQSKRLFPYYNTNAEAQLSTDIGKTVRIIFPIVIQDIVNEYVFEFKIDSISVQ
jgi:hypothetical protein